MFVSLCIAESRDQIEGNKDKQIESLQKQLHELQVCIDFFLNRGYTGFTSVALQLPYVLSCVHNNSKALIWISSNLAHTFILVRKGTLY